jgi:hypothetical protein
MQHDAGGGFVNVLPAVPSRPDERFFDLAFAHPELSHALGHLRPFIIRDRIRIHAAKLITAGFRGNALQLCESLCVSPRLCYLCIK